MQKGPTWMYHQYKLDEWGRKAPCLKSGIQLEKTLKMNDSQPCFRKASHPPQWPPVTVSMREGKNSL